MMMNPRAKYEGESFQEWRWRLNEWRVRSADKVAALRAEYDAAPVTPVIPGSPEAIDRCRELGGILCEWGKSGRFYIVDPAKWAQAEREAAEASKRRSSPKAKD